MADTPRVALDTNRAVSALLFDGGALGWLRRAWQTKRFIPLADRDTAAELIRVLRYPKFELTAAERESLLADFLPYAETVPPGPAPADLPALRDAHDVKFLALARRGRADALVTGDADILEARPALSGVAVLTPGDFAEWLTPR